MSVPIDHAGKKYGCLTVTSKAASVVSPSGGIVAKWNVVCECGKTTASNVCKSCLASEASKKVAGVPAHNRLPDGEAAFNQLFGAYRLSAKDRQLNFDLDKQQFRSLTKKDCFYCGASPTAERAPSSAKKGKCVSGGAYVYNGVDRVDSSVGYTVENAVSCCATCNRMKGVLSQADFIAKARQIVEKQGFKP